VFGCDSFSLAHACINRNYHFTASSMATFDLSFDELSFALEYALGIVSAPGGAAPAAAAAAAAPKAAKAAPAPKAAEPAKAAPAMKAEDDDVRLQNIAVSKIRHALHTAHALRFVH
jgi:hypothetical protein